MTGQRISASGDHNFTGNSCAIKTDGTVQCWGKNGSGQGTVPADLGSVSSISTGFRHTCAIKADDSLQCWGSDGYGQSSDPSGLGSVKNVAAGG